MKKLVPDQNGTTLSNLTDGVMQATNLTYTFNGSYILPANAGSPVDHVNAMGQTVAHGTAVAGQDLVLSVAQWANGLYFVQIESEGASKTLPLQVVR